MYESDYPSNNPHDSSSSLLQYGTRHKRLTRQELAKAARARGRIAILRGRAVLTRVAAQNQRAELQKLRQRTADSEAAFLKAVTALMLQTGTEELRAAYREVLSARDVLGPAIADYEKIEDQLNRQEYDLEEEENQFYEIYGLENDYVKDETVLAQTLSSLSSPYVPSVVSVHDYIYQSQDPLVQEYLRKLSEIENYKETLEEIEQEQLRYMEEMRFRSKLSGSIFWQDTASSLNNLEQNYTRILSELEDEEVNLLELRKKCVELGLFTATDMPY